MTVTVVILNFNRPDYIKDHICPYLEKIDIVDEIIISNGKKETNLSEKTSPKVKNLSHWGEMNENYGLTLRFLSAYQSKNEYVLIMDDDIIPDMSTVKFLHDCVQKEPDIIHGLYGRDTKNGYSYENVFGQVPIVLTRCMMTTKTKCDFFIENFRLYENDMIKNSKPYWNGEDILFSLLSVMKTGQMNKSYELGHRNRIWNYINLQESISIGGVHDGYRIEWSSHLIKKMNIERNIKSGTKIKKKKYQITYFVENSGFKNGFGYVIFGAMNQLFNCF
jgi:hypothetical protein